MKFDDYLYSSSTKKHAYRDLELPFTTFFFCSSLAVLRLRFITNFGIYLVYFCTFIVLFNKFFVTELWQAFSLLFHIVPETITIRRRPYWKIFTSQSWQLLMSIFVNGWAFTWTTVPALPFLSIHIYINVDIFMMTGIFTVSLKCTTRRSSCTWVK